MRTKILYSFGLLAVTGALGVAAELPKLRAGMWEYSRVVTDASGKPETIRNTKCSNPGEDMKQQNEMLTKAGCKFSPVQQQGNTYTFSADCSLQGGKIVSKTTSTLTYESDSAYTVKVQGETNGAVTSETLTARRTGDCKE